MLSKNSNRRSLFSVLLLVPSYDLCFSYLCKGSRASISSSISSEWMSCAFWPFLRFFLFFSSLYFMEKHLGKCCRKKYYVKKRVVTQQSFEGARTLGHIKTYKRQHPNKLTQNMKSYKSQEIKGVSLRKLKVTLSTVDKRR